MVVHRWETEGTLSQLKASLDRQLILHDLRVWEVKLNLGLCSPDEKSVLTTYCKGDLNMKVEKPTRKYGCIAVEPDACKTGDQEVLDSRLENSRNRVCFLAREKAPKMVISPKTVVGVQSCISTASTKAPGLDKISVIGGGHSENCLSDNAIAVDLQHWDYVEVDTDALSVRVGGGVTLGAITTACEAHGLVVPLGDRPGVGAGLILQGGLNHMMRSFGLACDNILRVVYVSPTGRLLVEDSDDDSFKFRGAGSNFGIVLEISLRAYKVDHVQVQDTIYPEVGSSEGVRDIFSRYSEKASGLPRGSCLDAFIFWKAGTELLVATSQYHYPRAKSIEGCQR